MFDCLVWLVGDGMPPPRISQQNPLIEIERLTTSCDFMKGA